MAAITTRTARLTQLQRALGRLLPQVWAVWRPRQILMPFILMPSMHTFVSTHAHIAVWRGAVQGRHLRRQQLDVQPRMHLLIGLPKGGGAHCPAGHVRAGQLQRKHNPLLVQAVYHARILEPGQNYCVRFPSNPRYLPIFYGDSSTLGHGRSTVSPVLSSSGASTKVECIALYEPEGSDATFERLH